MQSWRFRAAVLCALPLTALAQTNQTFTYTYNGSPISIPRSSANLQAVAEIFVPAAVMLNGVTVRLQVDYPDISDLQVALYSARGTRSVLLNNDCSRLVNIDTTFDDAAPSKYSDFCPAEAGRGPFRPDQPLANSKGELSAGYWDLVITNTKSDSRTGVLRSFSLTLTGNVVTQPSFTADQVINSASLDGGFVAPGELVSIYGVALGPQDGIQSPAGPIPTTLGGTTVTFDGQPAPILYASSLQLNVVAPYTLKPGTSTRIQVQSSGGTSGSAQLDVLSSVPGLFTSQTNGRGQALAVNQDGTVNSTTNPAAAGSVISLYATGLGAVNPAVDAGTPAPTSPLSTVAGVNVVIGGLSAPVQFAGLAPGYVGLYQINAQIPATTPSGANRVFLVAPNGYASPYRVFIQVK